MNIKYILRLAALCMAPSLAIAGVESELVNITVVRPYMIDGSDRVYIDVDSNSFCNTSTFSIDNARSGSKQAYAAALAAMLSGKKVRLEVDVCAGWGTTLRSLYVVQ